MKNYSGIQIIGGLIKQNIIKRRNHFITRTTFKIGSIVLGALIREAIVENAVMLLSVFVDAPFVRTLVWAYVTTEFRFRIHAFELPMPPEGSLHRVTLATIRAHISPLARFIDNTSSLLMLYITDVVSIHPLVRPYRWNTNVKSVNKSN